MTRWRLMRLMWRQASAVEVKRLQGEQKSLEANISEALTRERALSAQLAKAQSKNEVLEERLLKMEEENKPLGQGNEVGCG